MVSLEFKKVSLKRSGKWLLQSVDGHVNKEEHWVLYGLNGAGKTALLNMLCSYYFPTSGEMTVLGHICGKE
ncbi:ATP-binding cassette domain-containing protein, partial [Bacillus pumilus]|uniref:ATP-binding cassette domain-containing protein n=1 Tax=Bacillus pumilus TaxID=1408 RepID=UPI003C16596F